MDVKIEVAAMEGTALLISPKVVAVKAIFSEVVVLISTVATSVLRTLRQGRSSQNAVSPDYSILEGGLAVA